MPWWTEPAPDDEIDTLTRDRLAIAELLGLLREGSRDHMMLRAKAAEMDEQLVDLLRRTAREEGSRR